jgi:cell division protein ZipA
MSAREAREPRESGSKRGKRGSNGPAQGDLNLDLDLDGGPSFSSRDDDFVEHQASAGASRQGSATSRRSLGDQRDLP